jgi:hypothetical protein
MITFRSKLITNTNKNQEENLKLVFYLINFTLSMVNESFDGEERIFSKLENETEDFEQAKNIVIRCCFFVFTNL